MNGVLTTFSQNGGAVSGGPTRASDNTVYLLRSLIFTGQYEAGQKLPAERQLAEELGTSRITVRSALKALEALGFVTAKIGSRGGWWVTDPASLAVCWRNWMHSNSHQIDAMLECGEAIEAEIAAWAAQRRTPEQLQRLQSLFAQMREADSAIGPHYTFHRTLARAADNQYLDQAMAIIGNQLFLPSNRVIPDGMEEFYGSHEAIVSAVADQDPERARQAIKRHFRFSRHVFQLDG
jgi:GntR family transcriptional regulator, transcriptional repressor for pyruvate dehydrogenase complex